MTSPRDDRRERAFWLDAADLALTALAEADAQHDVSAQLRARRQLISVSCQCPQGDDPAVAELQRQIDEQIRRLGKPDSLRTAFRRWPQAAEWQTGDYAALLAKLSTDQGD